MILRTFDHLSLWKQRLLPFQCLSVMHSALSMHNLILFFHILHKYKTAKGTAMLNYLWAAMMLVGVVWGAATGRMEAVTNGALDSAKEAVTLCITMLGVMSLWTGLMEIASNAGIVKRLTKKIRPFMRFLFPSLPDSHPAQEAISVNFIANFLGLGWAATPAGIKAMEELADLEASRQAHGLWDAASPHTASREMCTFLILNISSLQLIPVNIIAYRSQYGSISPAAILAPSIIATLISTIVGILFCKIMDHKARPKKPLP